MSGSKTERANRLLCTDGDEVVLGLGAGGVLLHGAGAHVLDGGSNDEGIFDAAS